MFNYIPYKMHIFCGEENEFTTYCIFKFLLVNLIGKLSFTDNLVKYQHLHNKKYNVKNW